MWGISIKFLASFYGSVQSWHTTVSNSPLHINAQGQHTPFLNWGAKHQDNFPTVNQSGSWIRCGAQTQPKQISLTCEGVAKLLSILSAITLATDSCAQSISVAFPRLAVSWITPASRSSSDNQSAGTRLFESPHSISSSSHFRIWLNWNFACHHSRTRYVLLHLYLKNE